MKTKLKWVSIAIFLCFIVSLITTNLLPKSIQHSISMAIGLFIGVYCLDKYDSEVKDI